MTRRLSRAWLFATTALALPIALSTAAQAQHFERIVTWPVFQNLGEGVDPATQTVAEIVAASDDGMMLVYTDSPGEAIGMVDISDPAAPVAAGRVALGGEPTSVVVHGASAFAGVNTSASFVEPSGHVAVVDLATAEITATCDVGGQPDSVAISPDGGYLAIAIENERDEDLNDGEIPQLPAGHLAVFELADGAIANCDAATLVDLTGLAEVAGEDPEPEYVDINADNIAVVTLQENNHLALVDLANGAVVNHFPAGSVSLQAVDTEDDGVIQGTGSLADVPREPDAVQWIGTDRLVTANEGDYEGGSRGFTIFSAEGEVLYDAGNAFEHLGMMIGHFPDDRGDNKGTEPEGAEVARFGDETLIFINSERGNFVAVYRDTGAEPELLDVLPTAVGPEGSVAIPSRGLFAVATEEDSEEDGIRGSLVLFSRTADQAVYPQLVSATDAATGAPIGWGALSGLTTAADGESLLAVSDSYYAESRIFTIEPSQVPAMITGYTTLTLDGTPVAYDLEGIALRQGGGYWVVSEGSLGAERPNLLLAVAEDGTVEAEIGLPTDVTALMRNNGFEGVAAWEDEGTERVVVAFQREWEGDPARHVRLGVYTPSEESWRFVYYPIEAVSSPRGGWVGLSEITSLGDGRFAVLERDNQPGSYATFKVLTVISLADVTPVAQGGDIPVVEKTVAIDILAAMLESNGWISDKPEGIAVTADGAIWLVSDNDGVEDATGETIFRTIGTVDDLN
ncbi:MAG: esterase-like activity of phytase family protein [Azospirillaceae bacterium]